MKPHPKVAAKHYVSRPAKVKLRIKGQPDGPVYQGQVVVVPCGSCGGK